MYFVFHVVFSSVFSFMPIYFARPFSCHGVGIGSVVMKQTKLLYWHGDPGSILSRDGLCTFECITWASWTWLIPWICALCENTYFSCFSVFLFCFCFCFCCCFSRSTCFDAWWMCVVKWLELCVFLGHEVFILRPVSASVRGRCLLPPLCAAQKVSGLRCISVCLPACLSVCLSVRQFVCLSVSLSTPSSMCSTKGQRTLLSICLPTCLSVCLSVCLSEGQWTLLSICLPACLSACLFRCLLPLCATQKASELRCVSVCHSIVAEIEIEIFSFLYVPHKKSVDLAWSSYDRTWFSGPNKQEIFIFILVDFAVCLSVCLSACLSFCHSIVVEIEIEIFPLLYVPHKK
jgi:hypothetical protein